MADIPPPVDYLELWYKALSSTNGLVISFEGQRSIFRDRLYQARAASGDPVLHELSIILPRSSAQEIIIVKKVVEIPDEQTEETYPEPD